MMLVFMVPALLGVLTAGLAFICVLPMMFILIPLSFLAQMFMSLCIASGVANDTDVFTAIKNAWQVTQKNFWPLALMALLLYLVQVAAGLVISIPAWGAQMLFMIPLMSDNVNPEMMFTFFGIFMLVLMPLVFLIQGAAQAYVNSGWMLTYLRLTRTPEAVVPVPKIA
jgi:membrane-anchored glycerophosphoryl diester phosphodiesterase (GDPDase)